MSADFAARELFESVLPALFHRQASALRHLRGIVTIELGGRHSETWTIDLGPSPPHISPGAPRPADLHIGIDHTHVATMLRGELDLEAAQTDGSVHVEGDRALLVALAHALAPTSALGLRLHQSRKRAP